ncbi:MAG: ABC transporter substrate-binding protein [Alphaproteobacteria bacterium]|nr:ABC transporter substrate-binding protein [Alphaproteobacteria bacterium]
MTHTFPLRFAAFALILSLAAALQPASARAATTAQAEHFVQVNIDRGLGILSNKGLSEAQRRHEFRQFLLELADIRRTALFTLGAGRRTATPAQVDDFVEAFKNYAIAIYQARLSAFSGQRLKVKGGIQRAPGDFIVETDLVQPSTSSDEKPIQVDFRLVPDNSGFKVIDVGVVGVWLAIEERDQFTSFLDQHNDSVPTLTQHLQALTQRLREHPQTAQEKKSAM